MLVVVLILAHHEMVSLFINSSVETPAFRDLVR